MPLSTLHARRQHPRHATLVVPLDDVDAVALHVARVVALDVLLEVLLDGVRPVADDPEELVVAHQQRVVLLHHLVEVALRVQVDLLVRRRVLEAQLVEPTAAG